ncbi:MAG: ATP-binding cassette domain-containing protein [Spirochaetales bacterium]|nr:ATP-binding cassette domain-containing protein [Spirochaetales bacterium]
MEIKIKDLTMAYGDTKIFDKLNLTLQSGKTTCLLGESGCGKTTLLNLLAGTLTAQSGTIQPQTFGHVSFVFQDSLLLPWMNVLDNVAYLMDDRLTRKERHERAGHLIQRVGLEGYEKHYPTELSGGMSRRVTLARALGKEASLLLMDEPFSSLDDGLKDRLVILLKELLEEEKKTVLYVTHDKRIATELSDHVLLMVREEGLSRIIRDEF